MKTASATIRPKKRKIATPKQKGVSPYSGTPPPRATADWAPNMKPWRADEEPHILCLAVAGKSPLDIGKQLRLKVDDVEQFLRSPAARELLTERHQSLMTALAGQLLDGASKFVEVFVTLAQHGTTERIRLDAATRGMDFTLRINEHHLLGSRLDEIARKMQAYQQLQAPPPALIDLAPAADAEAEPTAAPFVLSPLPALIPADVSSTAGTDADYAI